MCGKVYSLGHLRFLFLLHPPSILLSLSLSGYLPIYELFGSHPRIFVVVRAVQPLAQQLVHQNLPLYRV